MAQGNDMAQANRWMATRRDFLKAASLSIAGMAAAPALAATQVAPSPVDVGSVKDGKNVFPTIDGPAQKPKGPTPNPLPWGERVGFAVVGLGRLSLDELLPAFGECHRGKPVALVSGSPEKARLTAGQYGIKPEAIYDYAGFDRIADNPEIQVVYIVLPNGMHREFVERAAKAGKHVLCEKPLATTVEDARAMVEACRKAGVKLMTAYRCQYEVYNRELIERSRSGELGDIRFIEASNSQVQGTPDQWRLKKKPSGGGALPDIGIYCLNAARYVTGEEPVEVFAHVSSPKGDPRFTEVEERVSFLMRFPSGVIAQCNSSYDAYASKDLTVRLAKGWIKLEGAFAYQGKNLRIAHRAGEAESIETIQLGEKNQFALEIDHMAECVKDDIAPRTPGEEGLQDMVLIEALYRSAATGKPVTLEASSKPDATRGPALKDS